MTRQWYQKFIASVWKRRTFTPQLLWLLLIRHTDNAWWWQAVSSWHKSTVPKLHKCCIGHNGRASLAVVFQRYRSTVCAWRAQLQNHWVWKQSNLSSPVASFDETNDMPYSTARVKGTLRVLPPTPIILPWYDCKGGLTLKGVFVLDDTEIAANPWITNRDQDIFGLESDQFRPEQWLEDAESTKEMENYHFSFRSGSGECRGKISLCLKRRNFVSRQSSPVITNYLREVKTVAYVAIQWLCIWISEPRKTVDT